MADQGVIFEGILLKPSMVTPGADCKKRATPEQVSRIEKSSFSLSSIKKMVLSLTKKEEKKGLSLSLFSFSLSTEKEISLFSFVCDKKKTKKTLSLLLFF